MTRSNWKFAGETISSFIERSRNVNGIHYTQYKPGHGTPSGARSHFSMNTMPGHILIVHNNGREEYQLSRGQPYRPNIERSLRSASTNYKTQPPGQWNAALVAHLQPNRQPNRTQKQNNVPGFNCKKIPIEGCENTNFKSKCAKTCRAIKRAAKQAEAARAGGGFSKGGRVPKAGLYKLHKGEVVVPAYKVKVVDAALKKSGKKSLKKVCKTCVMTNEQLKKRKLSPKGGSS